MRLPRPARAMLRDVSVIQLRTWAHLPHSPGITAPLANPDRVIDPFAWRTGLAVRCSQPTDPDRCRFGLSANLVRLQEVGLERNFISPTLATATPASPWRCHALHL